MKEIEFNLLDEPWIKVLDLNGKIKEVGLIEAFSNAHEYERLSGDTVTQDVALMRMMLAVLYAVYLRIDKGRSIETEDDAAEFWKELWDEKCFDMGPIGAYLEHYRDRFWLFHPKYPFYQSPIKVWTEYQARKLIGDLSESNNKSRLFNAYANTGMKSISYADAARWLLYNNAFDDTSAKPKQKEKKLPSAGVGWLGKLGLVYVRGHNLFETLMLNFVLINERRPFPDGIALWEREPCVEERIERPLPNSPVELLTIQSRRLLLCRENGTVIKLFSLGGDIIPKENAFTEQMTLWRTDSEGNFIPKRHNPSRLLWRDYPSLIAGGENLRIPGVVQWSSLLDEYGYFPYPVLALSTCGVKYADKDFFAEDQINDGLSLNASLLSDIGKNWNILITNLLKLTDTCVYRLGVFATDLKTLQGYKRDQDRNVFDAAFHNAESKAYFLMDQPFRLWLSRIDPEKSDPEKVSSDWKKIVYSVIVSQLGMSFLEDAGPKALVGTCIENKDSNAFIRYRLLKHTVRKILNEGVDEQKE